MAGLFNWLLRKNSDDFEKILADLDEQIRKSEIRLADYSIRKKKLAFLWTFYSFTLYILTASGFLFTFLVLQVPMSTKMMGSFISLYLILPMFQHKYEMAFLEKTRAAQRDKIEELKKKTAYYVTQGLIERYDSPVKTAGATPIRGTPGPQKVPATMPRMANGNIKNSNFGTPQQPLAQRQIPQQLKPAMNDNPFIVPGAPQIPQAPPQSASTHPAPPQTPRTWFDKFLEAMVGEPDGPQNRYALICESCFSHNGLILPHEYLTAKFKCMKCGQLNEKKSSSDSSSVASVMKAEMKKQQDVSTRPHPLSATLRHSQSLDSLKDTISSPTERGLDSNSPVPPSPLRNSSNDVSASLVGDQNNDPSVEETQKENMQMDIQPDDPVRKTLEASLFEAMRDSDESPARELETDDMDTSDVAESISRTPSTRSRSDNQEHLKSKSSNSSLRKRKGGSSKKKR